MMRKLIAVIVVLLSIGLLVFSFAELQSIRDALRQSDLVLLAGAFLLEILCLFNTATTFGALYRLAGLRESRAQLFLMATAANFVNMIAPSGGVGGIAVFLDGARRRGLPSARVVVVGILYVMYEYAALICVMVPGFFVLIRQENLNVGEVIAAGLLLGTALALGTMLLLGYRSAAQLGRLLAWASRLANRSFRPFLHRDLLDADRAHRFSLEVAEGISSIRANPRNLIWPLLFTLNNKALLLCVLAFAFLALNTPFTVGTLVGGFSISYLFFYASPTPSGVGFVEGIMPAALSAFGVPFTQAVLITLAFRGITVWFPLAVGAAAFRALQRQPALAAGDLQG
ncbi:MAG: lysylphosphatidylglycerol synthase transmembrane domain-containing protein [Bacteroidota bacterium]